MSSLSAGIAVPAEYIVGVEDILERQQGNGVMDSAKHGMAAYLLGRRCAAGQFRMLFFQLPEALGQRIVGCVGDDRSILVVIGLVAAEDFLAELLDFIFRVQENSPFRIQ